MKPNTGDTFRKAEKYDKAMDFLTSLLVGMLIATIFCAGLLIGAML